MDRRALIIGALCVLAAGIVATTQAVTPYRVGVISHGGSYDDATAGLRDGLKELGQSASLTMASEKRVALIIGNSAYQHTAKLANPRNDAADMVVALRNLGFDIVEGYDLDKAGFDRATREFARRLAGAHVSVFFYAGHGLQVEGQNYLVPIDAKLEDGSGVDFELIRVDLVHRTMERATRTSLLFLDACRDNPLARNLARALGTRSSAIGRGLAHIESGEGTLISFSTQPGNVALDGGGRNSPYASALIKQLTTAPNDDLSTMLIAVRNQVMRDTTRRQVPWEHSALTARFFFRTPGDAPTAAEATVRRFDGVWEVDGLGGEKCVIKRWSKGYLFLKIGDGVVTSQNPNLAVSGRVTEAGDLFFLIPSYANPTVTMQHTAKLSATTGEGTYEAGGCRGTTTFKKLH